MSEADRARWDERYGKGAYSSREHPSAILPEWLAEAANHPSPAANVTPTALDVACGAGRNAIYLAGLGFKVDAVDISTVGLDRARRRADDIGGLDIHWIPHDLDKPLPAEVHSPYDLIVLVRYVDSALVARLTSLLADGGVLIVEEHLSWNGPEDVIGPRDPRFRVQRGELAASVAGLLQVERETEGLVVEPDGSTAALARLLAVKVR